MTHIMLDLETWGTTPGSDIRSIGAVLFDPIAGWVHGGLDGQFYVATNNPIIAHRPGINGDVPIYKWNSLQRDPKTVQWWSEQSEEAKNAFTDKVQLHEACIKFGDWYYGLTADAASERKDIAIWSNGPSFDISILEAVYRAVYLPVPWHYRAPRCFRTIVDIAGITQDDMKAFNHGTAHNALDDAISQAKIVCEAYKRLGLSK